MHDLNSLIGIAVMGVLTGWLASVLVQGRGMGIIPDMVVGIVGAFLGTFLVDFFHIGVPGGFWGSLIVDLLGAVILLVLIRLVKSK